MTAIIDGSLGFTAPVGAVYNGLQTATAVSLSGSTSTTFTNIPSWVKKITVMWSAIQQTSGGVNPFYIQLGTSGGIVTSGYTGGSGYVGGGPAATSMSAAFNVYEDTPSTAYSGLITITNLTGNTWVASGIIGNTQAYTNQVGGTVTLSGALTQLKFTTASGTNVFSAGSINIIYE